MATQLPEKILIIDDDITVGQAVEAPLAKYKVSVDCAADFDSAILMFNQQNYGAIFIENEFTSMPGLVFIQKFQTHRSAVKRATPFILMSGKVKSKSDEALLKETLGVSSIIKPFNLVGVLPYLSKSVALRIKNLKYESVNQKVHEIIESGDVESGIKLAKEQVPTFGAHGVGLVCGVYEKLHMHAEAISLLETFIKKFPNSNYYKFLLAKFFTHVGRDSEALAILEPQYKAAPDSVARLQLIGDLYMKSGNGEKSKLVFKKLIEYHPEKEEYKFEVVRYMQEKGFHPEASKLCQEVTTPKEMIRFYNNEGARFAKEGKLDSAIQNYQYALDLFPKQRDTHKIMFNLALSLIKTKDKDNKKRAIKILNDCIALKPDFDKAKSALENITKNSAVPEQKAAS